MAEHNWIVFATLLSEAAVPFVTHGLVAQGFKVGSGFGAGKSLYPTADSKWDGRVLVLSLSHEGTGDPVPSTAMNAFRKAAAKVNYLSVVVIAGTKSEVTGPHLVDHPSLTPYRTAYDEVGDEKS